MKFHQLLPGARFRYQDTVFRKVSPLRGASETDGTQRLIPRSAEVVLLGTADEPAPEGLPAAIPGPQVEASVHALIADCTRALERIDPPLTGPQRTQLVQAIQAAGNDLLTRLAVPH